MTTFFTKKTQILLGFGKGLFLFFLLFVGSSAIAQITNSKTTNVNDLSDQQIEEFYNKAKASGMSEAMIEKAAKAQGFSPADIAKVRERIESLQNGKLKDVTNSKDGRTKPKGISTKKDSLSKVAKRDTLDNDSTSIKIFGMSLFQNKDLNFEPNLRLATPKNYQIGPDDELNVDIFGEVLDNYKLKVSPEGTVKILNLSPINVNGLTIEQATERIVGRLRQLYQGLNVPGSGSSAQVTLGNIRSINVTITGEVYSPGTYTLSSLATVFNALYLAGGPSENGSFRSIRVMRNNKIVRVLDLYDFLLKAEQKDNIRLQDNDVIRVSDYETRVTLMGEVKRPMRFEAKRGETLKDVLRFAGGFTDKAYTHNISLDRATSREHRLANISRDEFAVVTPQNGDIYTISKIIERFENRVAISGSVFRPGYYAIENGNNTLKELITKAEGLKEDAFLNRATLIRRNLNFDKEVIAFDLGALLRGEAADIVLHREDSINIASIQSLREKRYVEVRGEVNNPTKFEFVEGMTVGDLILKAGGLKFGGTTSRLQLSRRVVGDTLDNQATKSNIIIKTFDINPQLRLLSEEAKMIIQPFDMLFVRKLEHYEPQKTATVKGMVKFPGTYAIENASQKISDLIKISGGLRDDAYLEGARFYRDSTILGVNFKAILDNPESIDNLFLRSGDELLIPRTLQTVKLSGELQNPVAVSFKDGYDVDDYVSEAGGLTSHAARNQIYVKYPNGTSARTKHFLFINRFPKVTKGSEIVVPERQLRISKMTTGERLSIITGLVSFAVAMVTIVTILKK